MQRRQAHVTALHIFKGTPSFQRHFL